MTHFGIICPPYTGHLNPLSALAREIQSKGHRVTFLQISDLESQVRSQGINFYPIGETIYRRGAMAETFANLGKLSAIKALQYSLDFCVQMVEMVCQDAPSAIAAIGIEALIVDRLEPVGETVAEYLQLPFVCVASGQAIHRRTDVPPFFTAWRYNNAQWAQIRNRIAYFGLDRGCKPILQTINHYRNRWNLPDYPYIYAPHPKATHIFQQPPAFEFPLSDLPNNYHYVGPLRNAQPRSRPFPYEKLHQLKQHCLETGQALVYASLGSVQNTKENVFRCIAAACASLNVQLIIAHGGGMSAQTARSLPGSPFVVEYAPQPEILSYVDLAITHAGMNTTLDALSYGVPLVAIPITFEQPGTAARIRATGVGEIVALNKLNIPKLRSAIARVLTEKTYRKNAQRIQQSIQQAGGVKRAADLVIEATQANGQEIGLRSILKM
jgi:zeaxanthin glucosyltransferase